MDRIGRYKIVRELGRGAMGVVYHAIDPNIGRPVAIKTIQFQPTRAAEELDRMRDRLFREARSAGILSHPGIVTIYDVDQQDDLAYIAMEYVDGPTLEQLLNDSGPLTPEKMFSILGQTAVALDYAHSKGIVHRDIKPANIMLTADGTCKITDFGIAKLTTSEQLTRTGSIVGTPHYMSPEQVQGQTVDGRSDQFSLAVIVYEMLTGEKPYTGEHLTTVVYKIVAEEPLPPRRLNPTLTPAIEAALRKAMAKRPDQRYKACQEFAAALETACGASKGWKVMPRAGSLNAPTVADVAAARSPASNTLPPPRRPRRSEANGTSSGAEPRRVGFLPFLLATLAAGALLALIGWQAAPWLLPPHTESRAEVQKAPVVEPAPQSQPQTPPPAPAPAEALPTPAEAAPPERAAVDVKPSALGSDPGVVAPEQKRPEQRRKELRTASATPTGGPQDVLVISSPAGATARLDGNPATSCSTPCTLSVSPGRHTVSIAAPGHLLESREITVGSGPIEIPPVTLRASGGTLMLTSAPDRATVSINGHRMPELTPTTLTLAPGAYVVTVEKDGKQSTDTVVVKEGLTTYHKIMLNE
ncbi:MAG TPA: serine/threonine-protein kinase [Candidatus Acidoferrum sp.]|jgi:serine/threonine protein kinase|nr:serine/threonine-protein kinase [Candidatus Acidoferrum sp.]